MRHGLLHCQRTALRAGRAFTEQDVTPVAVIGALAWPSAGRRHASEPSGPYHPPGTVNTDITVVGVVKTWPGALDRDRRRSCIVPTIAPSGRRRPVRTAVIRLLLERAVARSGRRAIRSCPSPRCARWKNRAVTLVHRRFQMVLTLFGIVALLLGAAGVYGVVIYGRASDARD